MEPVLIVGLEQSRARNLVRCLSEEGFHADFAAGEPQARMLMAARQYRVLICSAEECGGDRVLDWLAAEPSPVATILVATTPNGNSCQALARGAADVVSAAACDEELALRARKAADTAQLERLRSIWAEAERPACGGDPRDGRDEAMLQAMEAAAQAASHQEPVLLVGEPGSGRQTLARLIYSRSRSRLGAFVTVDCNLEPGAFDARLFGAGASPDGAGVLEMAGDGAVFLNEVSAISPNAQLRLVEFFNGGFFSRVGQSRRIWSECRTLAATSANLPKLAQIGKFRADLADRFLRCQIEVPPLRRRPRAVERLGRLFLELARQKLHRPPLSLEPDAVQALLEHSWPGNVTELEAVMFRAALLADGSVRRKDLQIPRSGAPLEPGSAHARSWRDIERRAIEDALARHAGNRTHAARALGISLRKLQYRLRAYGLTRNGHPYPD